MEVFEVLSNDRYREREHQNSSSSTQSSHQFAQPRGRGDVTVAHSGHGDDAVVDRCRNGGEPRVRVKLYVVAEAADDEAGDAHEKDEESELLVAVLERVGDGLETRGVSGQLEDTSQLEYPEDLQHVVDGAGGGVVTGRAGGDGQVGDGGRRFGLEETVSEIALKEERHEEGEDREGVNDVDAVR